jgi:hypothetical protein
LSDLIVGSALEAVASEHLVDQHKDIIRAMARDGNMTESDIAKELHSQLVEQGIKHTTLAVDNMHVASAIGDHNSNAWFTAETVQGARPMIEDVRSLVSLSTKGIDDWFCQRSLVPELQTNS